MHFKLAGFQPELRECTSRTTFVLRSCEFPAGAAGVRFGSCGSALRVLLLYSQASSFQPELREHSFRTILWYLRIAILEPELARTRGESNPGRRDCERRRANHETTFKDHSRARKSRGAIRHTQSSQRVRRRSCTSARRHSESDSTRTISAHGNFGFGAFMDPRFPSNVPQQSWI